MTVRPLILALGCLTAVGCGSSSSSSSGATTVAATTSTSTTAPVASTGTAPGPSSVPPPANFQLIDFATVEQGLNSRIGVTAGASTVHAVDDANWTTLWSAHDPGTRPPAVDFTQDSVIGTFMRQTPGNANTSQVVNVWRDTNSEDLRALVREFRQGVWFTQTVRVQNTPYHMVRAAGQVSAQATLTVEVQHQLDFETIVAGSNNALGINNPAYAGGLEVFRDAAAFNAFFAQVQPGARPPAVDFQRDMVVAVLGGYIPRFGNTVQTLRILHDPQANELRVRSRVTPYSGGAAPPPAIEAPFQILRVTPASGAIRAEVEAAVSLAPTAGLARMFTGRTAETLVVRDAAEFAALWTARVGGTVPTVDFATDQVLLHFEPQGSQRRGTVARATQLEDEELAVTVTTILSGITRDPQFSWAVTPKTYGPVAFELVDVTPRP